MKEILVEAKDGGYAVGSFPSIDLAMVRGIIHAAEDENSPVILSNAEVHFKYAPLESIMPILLEEAHKAKVPVALLLDHGDEFSVIVKSIKLGMNSIMFDGSHLDYNDNVTRTKELAKIAHALDASIEAEIGRVISPSDSGAEGSDDVSLVENTSLYTDPDQAADFVQKTGIDALACAIGTLHGVYRKEPKLDFDRIKLIAEKTDIPLVMHGGSGLTKDDFSTAIANGISKINYYTNMALYVGNEIKKIIAETEEPFYHNITVWAQQAVYDDVRKTIRLFMGR